MQLAVIADIHGNLPALRAVLDDIAARGIGATVNLGDCVSGPLWPRECLELLQAVGIPSLRGNHDRWVADGSAGWTDAFARAALDPAQVAWLGDLPMQLAPLPGVLAFHARPADDTSYLLEEVADGRLVRAPVTKVAARLGPTEAKLILCAHSHQAGLLRLPDGRVVLNPGSVGCPAYADPTPPAHVSEAGTPFARYAVLEVEAGGLMRAELVALGYDHAAAAARAEACGRPDWAQAIATGLMPARA